LVEEADAKTAYVLNTESSFRTRGGNNHS
jgi:hypothetical protein